MNKTGKCHIFTLYFQEIPDDEKWIDTWAAIEVLAYRARTVQWRCEFGRKASKAFLDYHKSGIYIDTIEQPRVAVFIGDKVDVEVARKTGKSGCGRSTHGAVAGKPRPNCEGNSSPCSRKSLACWIGTSTWGLTSNGWMSWDC